MVAANRFANSNPLFSQRSDEIIRRILERDCIDLDQLVRAITNLASDAASAAELQLTLKILERIPQNKRLANFTPIAEAMATNNQIEIFFINDNGPYAGAGIALRRQAEAFAQQGHQCTIIALNHHSPEVSEIVQNFEKKWAKKNLTIKCIIPEGDFPTDRLGREDFSSLITEVVNQAKHPALVVIGNIHSMPISVRFIYSLVSHYIPVVIYAHDLDLISGGCAYPQYYSCDQFLKGCRDLTCLKPAENYPMSSSGKIEQQYIERSVISRLPGIQFYANSHWTASKFKRRFENNCEVVMLGLDTDTFSPNLQTRAEIREYLGIKEECLLVAVGADNLSRLGKGGEIVVETIKNCRIYDDISFLSFGHNNLDIHNVKNLGFTADEEQLAAVFQTADLFLNTATIEAFGQTAIEAAACGCPTICIAGSGLEDAVQHGISGIVLPNKDYIISTLEKFRSDRQALKSLSLLSSQWAQQEVSLERVYFNWLKTILSSID